MSDSFDFQHKQCCVLINYLGLNVLAFFKYTKALE